MNLLGSYIAPLNRILALPDARTFPAHGAVVPVVHARVRELIEQHEARLSRCAAAVESVAGTVYEVADASTWTRHEKPLVELDPANRTLAVNETMAHLEYMVEGQLTVDIDDSDVASFCAP